MNIFKLERILNHQHELHFNVPYDDNQASLWATERQLDKAREETEEWERKYHELEEKFKNFFDIPKQNELGEKFPWVGYVDIDGTIYKCKECEHETIIRDIVWHNFREEYLKCPAHFYDHKPQGTFQEEYFAMKYLGFVKVSAFENAPTKRIVFFYDKLTWKQSNVIYPR